MGREFRVLTALEGTDVPHARPVAFCTDESVLGTTFYVMERIDGWSPAASYRWPGVFGSDESARRGLAIELISGLAKVAMRGLARRRDSKVLASQRDSTIDRWIVGWRIGPSSDSGTYPGSIKRRRGCVRTGRRSGRPG